MKKYFVILTCTLLFMACNKKSNTNQNKKDTTESKLIGDNKDEHGCLSAAGETWSQVKQDCIRIFDEGQRLNPIKTKEGEAIISAFILFNEDKSEAELFLPKNNDNSGLLLKSQDKDSYSNDGYLYKVSDSTLYIDNEKAYRIIE